MWYITSVLWICSLGCLDISVPAHLFSEANWRPHPCWLTLTDLCSQAANTWCQIVGVCASNATCHCWSCWLQGCQYFTLYCPHTLVFLNGRMFSQFAKSGTIFSPEYLFLFFTNNVSMPLTFLLVDWLLEKLLAKSTCNSRGGEDIMAFMFVYYF